MTKQKPVWIDDDLHTRLKIYASKNKITMKESLKFFLDNAEKEDK